MLIMMKNIQHAILKDEKCKFGKIISEECEYSREVISYKWSFLDKRSDEKLKNPFGYKNWDVNFDEVKVNGALQCTEFIIEMCHKIEIEYIDNCSQHLSTYTVQGIEHLRKFELRKSAPVS